MRNLNEEEIRRACFTLHAPEDVNGCLFEVRIIDDKFNLSGYFTSAETLIAELRRTETRPNENIYITINYIDDACYARKQHDKFIRNATPTTSDKDVTGYQFIMIDLDPERTKGTSSSDAELEAARALSRRIFKYMKATGWNDPIVAESGNGVHLLYKVGFAVTPERIQAVKDALTALDMLFSTDQVKVDTTTFNPARICKLYGTMAQKGADTAVRPHRMSRMLYVPQPLLTNDIALVEALAQRAPQPDAPCRSNRYQPGRFDVAEWLQRHAIEVAKAVPHEGGMKYILRHCVFDPEHKAPDAMVIQAADGRIGYHCFHNSCADRHWKDVRLLFEPDAYSREAPAASYTPNAQMRTEPEMQTGAPHWPWLTPLQILERTKEPESYIRTGITELDRKLIGLKKGFVTVLSGLRACGKSSLLSQIALTACDGGHRVGMFSGELTGKNAMRWINLQAAGKAHTFPSQYEGRWYTHAATDRAIAEWLTGRFFLYDNDRGALWRDMRDAVTAAVERDGLDLIIIDNLMCLDLVTLGRDPFVRQSLFVNDLCQIAKAKNIHILFVAHPRKTNGFLRLQDIAGSNDIVNRVDNAIIMHRVGHDFEVGYRDEFKPKADCPHLGCTNVLEICKDRDNGTQDYFIDLWYEPESKRLRNSPAECVHYGWEETESGGAAAVAELPPF